MTTIALLVAHWRAAALAALLALVATLSLGVHHYRAVAASARAQAATAQAQVATYRADAIKNEAAVESEAADAAARAVTNDMIRENINASSTSSDCARSPAVRALLDGLRHRAAPGAPAGAGRAADVRR